MYRQTHHFQKVVLPLSKSGVCPTCGKRATRKSGEKFMQTINPFNKNPDGSQKTARQILEELREKAKPWLAEPVYHVKCEADR